jgi:hypothetical protein
MAILSKSIYIFNATSIKIPMTFFTPKTHMEAQETQNNQSNPELIMSNSGGNTIPDFILYYTDIKRAWCWHENRHMEYWS